MPNVVTAVDNLSLCTTAGADLIKDKIVVYNLNRIVVASCTPKTHEPVFRSVLKELGMSPSYLEFVNVREHVASVHMEKPEAALQKAKDLVRAGVARAAKLEDVPRK
ncbi:MAG: disulfide reductase, partial [Promethearchaeota archaeon]